MALDELYRDGCAAWQTVTLPFDRYATFVLERFPAELPPPERGPDLFIACACAGGDQRAIAELDRRCAGKLVASVGFLALARAQVDEAMQELRCKLFTGDGEMGPRIADYAGRGDLERWLHAAMVRTTLSLLRKTRHEVLVGEVFPEDVVDDAELRILKQRYGSQFRVAVGEAFARLRLRERNLLRHHVLDRLSIDELGTLYAVHRSTAARWLERARESLKQETLAILLDRLGVTDTELQSILRLIQSQLDVTLAEGPL